MERTEAPQGVRITLEGHEETITAAYAVSEARHRSVTEKLPFSHKSRLVRYLGTLAALPDTSRRFELSARDSAVVLDSLEGFTASTTNKGVSSHRFHAEADAYVASASKMIREGE